MTPKEITFLGAVLFFIVAVWNYLRFRRRFKKTMGKLLGVDNVKKIVANSKPMIQNPGDPNTYILKPNRRQRRAENKIKNQQAKHLSRAELVAKIKQQKDRIRSGEIIEANEFLHILKDKPNGKDKK